MPLYRENEYRYQLSVLVFSNELNVCESFSFETLASSYESALKRCTDFCEREFGKPSQLQINLQSVREL